MHVAARPEAESFWDTLVVSVASLFGLSRFELAKRTFAYVILLPILIIYTILRIIPILQNFLLSLYRSNLISPQSEFIGLTNFVRLVSDDSFRLALRNTTFFAVFVVFFSVIIALGLATVLAGNIRLGGLYETLYFLPVITPMVPVAVVWKWIYDPTYGLLNYILSRFGIGSIGWLVRPDVAMWAIIIMSVWKVVGYNMVIFLVGIRDIPDTYYEAARIDGASNWSLFRHITLPLLRPIILFVLVVSTISAYNVFTQVFIMTTGSQGAPGNAVRVLVYDMYENAFRYFKWGYAASEAVILFLIVLALTFVQFRLISVEE